jgi:hypothetical protein
MVARTLWPALLALSLMGLPGLALAQDGDEQPDPVVLAIALSDAHTTLEKAIVASEPYGTPVSARFDMSSGDLQLSVYTSLKDGFAEVVANTDTGAVTSVKRISASESLSKASAQKAAMEKAKLSLLAALERAAADDAGSRAVSVVPELRNGHPVAVITLLVDTKMMIVPEWLE